MKRGCSLSLGGKKIKKIAYLPYIGVGALVLTTVVAGLMLSVRSTHADMQTSRSSAVSVTVANACTLTGGTSGTSATDDVYSVTVSPNTSEVVNGSKLTAICNDAAGYSIYAIGFSGDSYTDSTHTSMISSVGTIGTNLNTSGNTSGWAMMLSQVSSGAPEILNSFDAYHAIPSDYTQIVRYTSPTGSSSDAGTQVQTSYRVFVSSAQPAGTYTGKVKYTMIHPNNSAAPTTPITLDTIATSGTTHYMQESINCADSTVGTKATLTDSRDGNTYQVAKAADGQCWMIQSLKLGKGLTSGNSIALTPANSNINGSFTLSYSDIPADGKFHAYTVNGIDYQNNSNEFICRDDYDTCYYNWYTATAGAGTTYVESGTVDTSICPAGWTLPTQPQFSALYNKYNSAALMEVDNPTTTMNNNAGKIPGFLLSGYYGTGGAYNLGSNGSYWSRSAYSAQNAYNLSLNASSVSPAGNGSKYNGFAVRCILR